MKLLLTLIFCWVIILVSGAEQLPKEPIEKNTNGINVPIEPTVAPDITTTTAPITTTTPKPTTLKPTTTTSNATTPDPKNTTTTTTSTTSTTTTTSTTSTTTPKPDPTPAPPTPKPEIGQWTVVNGTNYTCIVLRMAAQFNITYITSDNKTMSRQMIMPSNNLTSPATGTCGDPEQVIEVSWKSSEAAVKNDDSLIFHFKKNETQSIYSLHSIEVKIAVEELPKFNSSLPLVLIHNASEYQIPLINSYRCLKSQKISLSSTINNTTGILEVSDLQFQAFKNEKNSAFSTAQDCPYETPDYVPIAVGCGLIILVVVVLVAYLVGRRRSQSRGYRSM